MAMLSLIMKIEYDSKLTWSFLVDATQKIISTPHIFKAFYKFDDFIDFSPIYLDDNLGKV